MANDPTRCAWCKRILDKNGDPGRDAYKLTGVRWYKVRRGHTHAACFALQMKKENSEPVFSVPLRLVPPWKVPLRGSRTS